MYSASCPSVLVCGGERGDGVKFQQLNSSHELQRMCVMVFGRFHRSHRIKGLEVGVEHITTCLYY